MFRAVAAISALLLAAAILLAGNGLQGTLLSVRGQLEGFSPALIGLLMTAYFVGFIAGCRINPGFIKSVGHIRTFTALASIASASALAHALAVDGVTWAILRAITGFCFAGLIMIIESWLNERSTNAERGRLLSIYRIADLVAIMGGNALLAVADPASFHLFAAVSILISVALVPVALTRTAEPKPIATARLDIAGLFRVSPVAAIGAPLTALANGSFWAVAPVFVLALGYDAPAVASFVIATVLGAALSQWPLGWISDRIDRRKVMAGAAFLCAVSAAALSQLGGRNELYLLCLGAMVGAFMLPMFGLNAAHANDHSAPENAVSTNGGLLLLHGMGSAVGASAGGIAITLFGPTALYIYIATIYAIFCAFCVYRITARGPAPDVEKAPFSPVPASAAPTVFEIAQEDATEAEEPGAASADEPAPPAETSG